MKDLRWLHLIIVTGLFFLAGWLYVKFLIVDPVNMSLYLTFTLLVLFGIFFYLFVTYSKLSFLIITVVIGLIFFTGGYATGTYQLMQTPDERAIPELTRSPDDPGNGHTAVVYFTHGEPTTYDPIAWVNQFNEFDHQKIKFIPFLARPFFIKALRDHYLIIGASNHVNVHKEMIKSLEEMYRASGDNETKFYLSFLDADPLPKAAIIQALNEGASKVIVSEVFLTVSNHTQEGENQIKEILEKFNIAAFYTDPLWNSDKLISMFLNRLESNVKTSDKSKVGVLLVGHGQPEEWDLEFPTETEHEIAFRESVIELLASSGYNNRNLSQAWMSFKEPKPKEKIEEFVANGCEEIYYFSAAISADSMHSQYDIPSLVNEAKVPDDIEIISLGAWNNDPIVIEAIKAEIDRFM